jgi:hypothetical protein
LSIDASHKTNKENATSDHDRVREEIDFQELLETGRVLWPTYFQLAAMSFAWNASLAAGFSILFNGGWGSTTQHLIYATLPVSKVAMITIAIVGVVYNAGALAAYILMNNLQRSIIQSIDELPDRMSTTVTAELLGRFISRQRKQALKHLTHLFFMLLCFAWVIAGTVAIFVI